MGHVPSCPSIAVAFYLKRCSFSKFGRALDARWPVILLGKFLQHFFHVSIVCWTSLKSLHTSDKIHKQIFHPYKACINFKQPHIFSESKVLFKRDFMWKKKTWQPFAYAISGGANAWGSDTNWLSLFIHCPALPHSPLSRLLWLQRGPNNSCNVQVGLICFKRDPQQPLKCVSRPHRRTQGGG